MKFFFYVKFILGQLANLSNPVSDAAVVGLMIKLFPSIHLNTAEFVGILAGVGIVARWILAEIKAAAQRAATAYAARKAAAK